MDGFEEHLENYIERWDLAVVEDNEISENQQVGASSLAYSPGPYADLEFATHRFDNYVLDKVLHYTEPGLHVMAPKGATDADIGADNADQGKLVAKKKKTSENAVWPGVRPQAVEQDQNARAFSSCSGHKQKRPATSPPLSPPPSSTASAAVDRRRFSTSSSANRRFEGKTAIVTGAGRDIGAATAMRLALEGAAVVVHYHSSSAGADAVVEAVEAMGGRAVTVGADLATKEGAVAVVEAGLGLSSGGAIDVLVHNSGGLVERRGLDEMDTEFLKTVFDLNFTSLFHMAQICAPHMPSGSSIVTLSSQAARDGGGPGAGAYAASKGAVHTYTRSLAKELGGQGVRVNTVTPGMINTGFHDKFTADQVRTNVAGATLLGREGDAAEVASVIAFLASDDGSYVTGTALDINGGLVFSG